MLQNNIKLFILFLILGIPVQSMGQEYIAVPQISQFQQANSQRWGVFTGILVQNAPFRELATFQLNSIWYAQQYKVWNVGKAAMGTFVGFSYDKTFNNRLMFRLQGQLETTGWIAGIIDIGIGVRLPIARNIFFSIETYFSILQTGGKLTRIGSSDKRHPDSLSVYMGMFGFKGRMAVEFPISQKFFLTPYISYSAYPWIVHNLNGSLFVNGLETGTIIDSLQIGLEFGSKF